MAARVGLGIKFVVGVLGKMKAEVPATDMRLS